MRTDRLNEIERRADSIEQMEELPDEMAAKLPQHYREDVPALLLEIQRLENRDKMNTSIMHGKDKTIDNLQNDLKAAKRKMRQVAERYDLQSAIFEAPAPIVIKNGRRPPARQTTINNTGE